APSQESEQRTEPGVTIVNRSTDFRFERLLIRSWDGRLPSPAEGGKGMVYSASDRYAWNDLAFDTEANELIVTTADGEQRLALEELGGIVFPPPEGQALPTFRLTLHGGLRVSGELEACTQE